MLSCQEAVSIFWAFVIGGFLASLPRVYLLFQQQTSRLCRFREQTTHSPSGNEAGHSHPVPSSNQTGSFHYAKQEHCRVGDKKPVLGLRPRRRRKGYITLDTIIWGTAHFLPFKAVAELLTLLWIDNFSSPPSHTSEVQQNTFQSFAAFDVPPIYLNSQIHRDSDSV